MSIYTIGDLHLSHQVEKPMNIFGSRWQNHEQQVRENWSAVVKECDIVVMPGDFSWATYLDQAEEDFKFLGSLPGEKIMLKGNHDYWWETVTKMKSFLERIEVDNIEFLYNNSFCREGVCFCGTKGWDCKEEKDEKIINREISRLNLSIKSMAFNCDETVAVFHFPPDENLDLMEILKKNNINKCIYGHKHGLTEEPKRYFKHGIEFINASADQINFTPVSIYFDFLG